MARLHEWCERISDGQLFAFAFAWVIVGGLFLQLVVLPYVIPFAHWGHGLIANQDSVGFHIQAAAGAERIRREGWSAVESLHPDFPIRSLGILYSYSVSEPWVVLPINAVLFAVALVALRRSLAIVAASQGVALLALLPFFVFPSFVPIWGQLHKDLPSGTGLALVLSALVVSARQGHRGTTLLQCVLATFAGMGLLWLSRSYAMSLTTAATIAFAVVIAFERGCRRTALAAVVGAVLLAAVPSLAQGSTSRGPQSRGPQRPPSDTRAIAPDVPLIQPANSPWDMPRLVDFIPRRRTVNFVTSRYENCLPLPAGAVVDTVLYNLCHVREGFVIDGISLQAGSIYDSDVRLRTAGDFIAYTPRALQVALVEPGPSWWVRTKESTVGALGHTIVPIEMTLAYAAFALAIIFGHRQITRPPILAFVCFCLTYIVFYVVAIPQMGTLYRMRAFAFTIMVSCALTFVFGRLKPAE